MDDDAEAGSSWASALMDTFSHHPSAAIVGGPVKPLWPDSRPTWLHPWLEGYLTILDRGARRRPLDRTEWLAGTNIAFRREILQQVGQFNEALGRSGKLLLSNEEIQVTDAIRGLGHEVYYDPAAEMKHNVHKDRINHAWMRRRIAWQVISDLLADKGESPEPLESGVMRITSYLNMLPRKDRGISGLFLDTNDPDTFHKQSDAIAALMKLLATCGADWRGFLEPPSA